MPHLPGHTSQTAQGWDSFTAGPAAVPATAQTVLNAVRDSLKTGTAELEQLGSRMSLASEGAAGPGTGVDLDYLVNGASEDDTNGFDLLVESDKTSPVAPTVPSSGSDGAAGFSPLILGGLVLGGFYLFTR